MQRFRMIIPEDKEKRSEDIQQTPLRTAVIALVMGVVATASGPDLQDDDAYRPRVAVPTRSKVPLHA